MAVTCNRRADIRHSSVLRATGAVFVALGFLAAITVAQAQDASVRGGDVAKGAKFGLGISLLRFIPDFVLASLVDSGGGSSFQGVRGGVGTLSGQVDGKDVVGFIVKSLPPDHPFAKHVEPGEFLFGLDGYVFKSKEELYAYVRSIKPGQFVLMFKYKPTDQKIYTFGFSMPGQIAHGCTVDPRVEESLPEDLRKVHRLAQSSNSQAMLILGEWLNGKYFPDAPLNPRPAKDICWYRAAALAGDPDAMYEASMTFRGRDDPRQAEMELLHLTKAIYMGNVLALDSLSISIRFGKLGHRKDEARAEDLSRKAHEAGFFGASSRYLYRTDPQYRAETDRIDGRVQDVERRTGIGSKR